VAHALDVIRQGKVIAVRRAGDERRFGAVSDMLIDSGVCAVEFALTTPAALKGFRNALDLRRRRQGMAPEPC
jgi:2-keto-3-deoxy-6-phosphogluconate aldolase